jgi:hypothetical protein
MTDEHVIPEALGGRLIFPFLCGNCNSMLGHRVEATVRSDPTVRLLVNELRKKIPTIAQPFLHRQRVISDGPGGKMAGFIKNGNFVVESKKNADDSLIQPTPDARRAIETILKRQGYDAPLRTEALRRFDEAPENTKVEVAPGLEIVKWQVTDIELALDGPLVDPVVPIKSAFEFLAGHLGTAIYDESPPLNEVRRVLGGGGIDISQIRVERLHAPKSHSFHGIIFEGNNPHAQVQIRLFGKLAFRVHFLKLAVGGPRIQYTHDLTDNKESLVQVDDGDKEFTNKVE